MVIKNNNYFLKKVMTIQLQSLQNSKSGCNFAVQNKNN